MSTRAQRKGVRGGKSRAAGSSKRACPSERLDYDWVWGRLRAAFIEGLETKQYGTAVRQAAIALSSEKVERNVQNRFFCDDDALERTIRCARRCGKRAATLSPGSSVVELAFRQAWHEEAARMYRAMQRLRRKGQKYKNIKGGAC